MGERAVVHRGVQWCSGVTEVVIVVHIGVTEVVIVVHIGV